MKILSAAVLSVILFVSFALLPAVSSAQNAGEYNDTYMNSDANTGSTLLNGTNTKFDPMWLLPLLIVPVAYVIYKAANNDLTMNSFDSGTSWAGAKGGKAIKHNTEEKKDEEDEKHHDKK